MQQPWLADPHGGLTSIGRASRPFALGLAVGVAVDIEWCSPGSGARWFTAEGGLIRESRSYYRMRATTTELDGFPYAERGCSLPAAERSTVHPDAERYGPGGTR